MLTIFLISPTTRQSTILEKTIAQQFLREPLSGWSISVKDGKFEKVLSVQVSDALPPSVWRRSLDLIPTPVRPGGRRGG